MLTANCHDIAAMMAPIAVPLIAQRQLRVNPHQFVKPDCARPRLRTPTGCLRGSGSEFREDGG